MKERIAGWKAVAAIGAGAAVLGLAWWLGSPLLLNRVVNEAPPTVTAASDSMMKDEMKKDDMKSDGMMKDNMKPADMMKDDMMAKPDMAAYLGSFTGADALHKAQGKVTLIAVEGRQYLRFEELMVTNGPDLFVYLIRPGSEVKEGTNLGALKGNLGSQNYELPPAVNLMEQSQVVIWCRAFDVTFGTADLMVMKP